MRPGALLLSAAAAAVAVNPTSALSAPSLPMTRGFETAKALSLDKAFTFEEGVYVGGASELAQTIVARVPGLTSWSSWYKCPPLLGNGHAQTIFASKLRKTRGCDYARQLLTTPDGGTLALDLLVSTSAKDDDVTNYADAGKTYAADVSPEFATRKFLLLLSGLGGGSQDGYVRSMAASAMDRGWRVGVLNMRSCGGAPVTSPRFFSAHRGSTDDVRVALEWIGQNLNPDKIAALGWSNSGSIATNLLAEQAGLPKTARQVDAACALATPLNMPMCSQNLDKWFHRNVYDRSLGSSLARNFRAHRHLFEENGGPKTVPRWEGVGGTFVPDAAAAAASVTIREIDAYLTAPCFGFATVDAYYASASCDSRLADVRTPLLIVNALDDPIAPLSTDRAQTSQKLVEAIATNPCLALAVTAAGGHLGWVDADEPRSSSKWIESCALDFLDSALVDA
ncbi:Alpha/Beta hydrolase protein [Pelagophyceae sp. CCMP2097]|nr:Alpha/Beta hydrolase protein [Pelagophyceae sp. CCMP2097]|mmetsp:Transcript_32758/g.110349  ORF Transcript_32758/g.110349 Transcript_32758/m.110349 type:complete len:452 (+) Transcript_32758:127-1482(+)